MTRGKHQEPKLSLLARMRARRTANRQEILRVIREARLTRAVRKTSKA